MATEPNGKKSIHRKKAAPAPPALGIAERSGDGYKFTIVLGGLKVNGKRHDPQAGADILADMLEDGMKRLYASRQGPSPDAALQDPGVVHPATNGDGAGGTAESGDAAAPSAPAMAAVEDNSNGSH